MAVPFEYSVPAPDILLFFENTFIKPKLDIGLGNSQFNRP
jgi:hypothetical protein